MTDINIATLAEDASPSPDHRIIIITANAVANPNAATDDDLKLARISDVKSQANSYASQNYTYSNMTPSVTLAHGLGGVPDVYGLILRLNSTNQTIPAGTEFYINTPIMYSTTQIVSMAADSTNLYYSQAGTKFQWVLVWDGAERTLDNSAVGLKLYAVKF